MHVIMIGQNKGGDGKSTLTRLLAEYFARSGRKTLAIDLDSQCNLSQRFLAMDHDPTAADGVLPPVHPDYDPDEDYPDRPGWNGRCSIADIYEPYPVFPYATEIDGLEILPGHGEGLSKVEHVRLEEVKARVYDRLDEFLRLPDVSDLYDIVLIDTPPSKGSLVRSAMRAADYMVIPCQMEPQSIEGLQGMVQLFRQENRSRPIERPLRLIGIVANKVRKNVSLHEGLRTSLETSEGIGPYLIKPMLHQRTAFAEVDHQLAKPKSIFDLHPENPARLEAEAVCQTIDEALTHGNHQ